MPLRRFRHTGATGALTAALGREPLRILAHHRLLDALVVQVDQAAQQFQMVIRIGEQRDTPGLLPRRGGVAEVDHRLAQDGADEGILGAVRQGMVGLGGHDVSPRVKAHDGFQGRPGSSAA
jgi:hypothetical protein